MVVYGHSYVMAGFGPEPLERLTKGAFSARGCAVDGFFILSSYLLCLSLERSPSLLRFTIRRSFRILPGYWACLLFTAFVVVPASFAIFYGGQLSYWQSVTFANHNALSYLATNATVFVRDTYIMGVFDRNPLRSAMNASLWTIRWEVICYIALGLGALFSLQKRRWATTGLFAFLYAREVFALLPAPFERWLFLGTLGKTEPENLILAFSAGALLYSYARGRKLWSARWFWGATAALGASLFTGFSTLVWPLTLPYLLVCLAEKLPFQALEKRGDISYGVYLYSFLLQQCLVAFDLHHAGWLVFFATSVVVSVVAGCFSWLLVERPSIACGARLVGRLGKAKA